MEQEKGADPVRDLLERLVGIVKDGQESNRKLLANHSEAISTNRDALAAVAELVNQQTRAFDLLRDVVLKLWTDRYGPDLPLPDATVN